MRNDRYIQVIERGTIEKIYFVKMVCEFALSHLRNVKKHRAVCLDGELMQTTQTWLKHKVVTCNQVTIPEIDMTTHLAHQSFCQEHFARNCSPRLFHGRLHSLIAAEKLRYHNLAFFDFMGDYFGCHNKQFFPMRDLYDFLQYNVRDRITLAFTVALQPFLGDYFTHEKRETSIQDHFKNVLLPNLGYKIKKYSHLRYVSRRIPMLFICCNLVRSNEDNDIEWPFYVDPETNEQTWCGFPRKTPIKSSIAKEEEWNTDWDEEN